MTTLEGLNRNFAAALLKKAADNGNQDAQITLRGQEETKLLKKQMFDFHQTADNLKSHESQARPDFYNKNG